ncbi:MAG TPA: hypothetical protein VI893_06565 [Thermoplasmata archaeon]|nr:hypothetical protein [Thermoplasmata archaeon]
MPRRFVAREPRKVVQTEVDLATYGRLKHLADRRGETIKAVVKEAVKEFLDEEEGSFENDTFTKMIGTLRLKERDWSTRKDWRP